MSITLEIRGQTSGMWPLTPNCLSQITRLRQSGQGSSVDVLFGEEDTQDGTLRIVTRIDLVEAINDLISTAKDLPGGFEVYIPPQSRYYETEPTVGSGGVGALINGRYHLIRCMGDYWILQPTDEIREGKQPIQRYDTAEIQTENFGIIRVSPKKSRRSEVMKLLLDLRKFVNTDLSEQFEVTWG